VTPQDTALSTPRTEGGTQLNALDAYAAMLRIRLFEERVQALRDENVIAGSVHLCAGQEAIPVGAAAALREDDRIVPTYRGHGWAIARGVPIDALLAEICQRATGINGGRGGSAYFTAPRYGLALGENSIVGAGVPIAGGLALAGQLQGSDRVVVVSIGDGATSQGAVHEALVFAAGKRLPLVVVCENNAWSEMTATGAMLAHDDLAARVRGYGITAATIDGCDPFATHAAVAEATARARAGEGPSFLDCKTIRLWGHYNADIEHYRPKEDKEAAAAADPLPRLRRALLERGEAGEGDLTELETTVRNEIADAEAFARSSPDPDPSTARDHVSRNVAITRPQARADGEETTYVLAVNAALRTELTERPELVVFGEDVGVAGGVFGATRNLQREFGADRVFDTPIAESAILGAAIGLAAEGLRPVAEIMWSDFLLVALDQLVNQAANARYISRGETTLPLVVRTQQGVTPGSCAQHSQSLEALLAHVPGLRVGLPATPQDAYSMLRAAIADDDPCIVIESRALYQQKGPLSAEPDPDIGGARLHRTGSDVVLITWGRMLHATLAAAETLAGAGIETTVLDLRWLSPLDEESIAEAVDGGGRVLVVHEANRTGGFGAEIAARLAEHFFDSLDAPVKRIAAPDVRFPAAPALQNALLPDATAIVTAAQELIAY
jgi:2-oxoisovalerate dehydrogenase E1 component